MLDTILFLAAPFTACLLLVGILSYFGNHILTRGVIFVDIAVAQVAALGTMIGILLGASEGSVFSLVISLGFTILIVSIFAISKFKHKELSQEVIIGIIYCVALSIAYLLVDSVEGGSNFVQKTFTGAILWVSWKAVFWSFGLYSIVGIVHLFFYKRFIKISDGKHHDIKPSHLTLLDLLFYISFGVVIVDAVKIGGIFVIFMFLIAPASISAFLTNKWSTRFIISWITGLLGSIIGIIVSYMYNLSNGPTIVVILGIMLIFIALFTNKQQAVAS